MRHRQEKRTLRQTVAHVLIGHLVWFAAFSAAFLAGHAAASGVAGLLHQGPDTTPPGDLTFSPDGKGRPLTPEQRQDRTVRTLAREHHCYSGATPTPGVVPRFAVVTLPNHQPALLDSSVGFDIWLGHRSGVLHAFCNR